MNRPTGRHAPTMLAVLVMAVALGGCATAPPETVPTPRPTSSPVIDLPAAPAVVTFDVAGQGTYSIELVRDDLIEHAAYLLAGGEEGRIPKD